MADENDLRRIALSLPHTTERPSWGTPGFRVSDRLFARIREEGVAVLWCADLAEKDALIAADPLKFFTVPHYDGHASVLVRLESVDPDELTELLTDAWRCRASRRQVAAFDASGGSRP
jgi:hypothetical protein